MTLDDIRINDATIHSREEMLPLLQHVGGVWFYEYDEPQELLRDTTMQYSIAFHLFERDEAREREFTKEFLDRREFEAAKASILAAMHDSGTEFKIKGPHRHPNAGLPGGATLTIWKNSEREEWEDEMVSAV